MLPNELALYFDPAIPLPPARRRVFWAMYRYNVAWADDRLGRLIQALRSSGEWDRTLLVVTSTHGEEFGEKGQILNGGNLGRQLLEVPFAVKLPRGFRLRIAEPQERRIAAARLWATLVEAAGGEVPPAVAPSLFHRAPGRRALGALPDQRHQPVLARRRRRPAPLGVALRAAAAGLLPARLAMMRRGNARIARAELAGPPEEILGRLRAAFAAARRSPATGGAPADPRALGRRRRGASRWPTRGGRPSWPAALARTWNAFIPAERPPEEEAREWYTAESP